MEVSAVEVIFFRCSSCHCTRRIHADPHLHWVLGSNMPTTSAYTIHVNFTMMARKRLCNSFFDAGDDGLSLALVGTLGGFVGQW